MLRPPQAMLMYCTDCPVRDVQQGAWPIKCGCTPAREAVPPFDLGYGEFFLLRGRGVRQV